MTTTAALQLALGAPYRPIQAIDTTDLTDGSTRYQLSGPRLTGSITITAERWPDTARPVRVTIDLGYRPHPDGPTHDRPIVNGIEAANGATIDLDAIDRLSDSFLPARRARYRPNDNYLPAASSRYLGAAALAALRHWRTRPDREALMLATARYYAPGRLQRLQEDTIEPLRKKLDETRQELTAALRLAEQLQTLVAGADLKRPAG